MPELVLTCCFQHKVGQKKSNTGTKQGIQGDKV